MLRCYFYIFVHMSNLTKIDFKRLGLTVANIKINLSNNISLWQQDMLTFS